MFFLRYESATIERMIGIYCRGVHETPNGLCPACKELKTYAFTRLDVCPLKPRKPVCSKCPVHCYHSDMRDRIRTVMRYAGPRMVYKAPFLTMIHGIHSLLSGKSVRE